MLFDVHYSCLDIFDLLVCEKPCWYALHVFVLERLHIGSHKLMSGFVDVGSIYVGLGENLETIRFIIKWEIVNFLNELHSQKLIVSFSSNLVIDESSQDRW